MIQSANRRGFLARWAAFIAVGLLCIGISATKLPQVLFSLQSVAAESAQNVANPVTKDFLKEALHHLDFASSGIQDALLENDASKAHQAQEEFDEAAQALLRYAAEPVTSVVRRK
jgi:hypothetical protein